MILPKTSSQKGTVVLGIIILVFAIMLAFLFFIIALGMVKGKFEAVCKWQVALDIILGGDKQKALDTLCKLAKGDDSTGTDGAYGCTGSALNTETLKKQLQSDEGLRLYPYKDTNGKCTIGYGHNLEGGSNDNFTSVVTGTGKTPQDFISSCCPNSSKECSTPHSVITEDQAKEVLQKDIAPAEVNVKKIITTYDSLPGDVKQILLEMYFQLGGNLDGYNNMKSALGESPPNYTKAAQEMIDSKTYNDSGCGDDAQKAIDKANIANLTATGSCRTIRQAVRMRDIICKIAVIPPSPTPIDTCYLEKNCNPIGTYIGDGKSYNVCQAVADKIPLVQIDSSKVKLTNNEPKYIYSLMEDALEQASQNCSNCFSVNSAYRTCAHQTALCGPNGKKDCAAPGGSNHNGGQGADLNGSGEYECNSDHCSQKLVDYLLQYGLKHYMGCSTPNGNFYTGSDCVHFSPTGH